MQQKIHLESIQNMLNRHAENKRLLGVAEGKKPASQSLRKSVMVVIGKGYLGLEAEQTMASIKAQGDMESKNIYLLPPTADAISSNIRKIKKQLLEYVSTYNDEKYKKYKK